MPTLSLPVLKKEFIAAAAKNTRDENADHAGVTIQNAPIMHNTKIIVPGIPFAFEASSVQEETQDAIREKITKYLEANPHKINSIDSSKPADWKIKEDGQHQRTWIYDANSKIGVIIELDDNNKSKITYIVPNIIAALLFSSCIALTAYFDALTTAVQLPGNASKMDVALAWTSTVVGSAQDFISYFAFRTPQNIDFFFRNMYAACKNKEYDLNEDFELSSTCQSIMTALKNHPAKAVIISLLSLAMVGATLFSTVMETISGYDPTVYFLTQAREANVTTMDLDTLIPFGMTMYLVDSVVGFVLSLEQYALAVTTAIIIYHAMQNKFAGCANKSRFAFASENKGTEKERLLQNNLLPAAVGA